MRKKIAIPKKTKSEIDKYPMVSVEWFDIVSDSSWTSFDGGRRLLGPGTEAALLRGGVGPGQRLLATRTYQGQVVRANPEQEL